MFCLYKPKTSYEMRMSDWRSDVCSSDLDEAATQAFVRVLELKVVVTGGHQPSLGQGDGHARGVAGDPAATPFLGDVGGGAGAAGGIEYKVAGICGHQNASRSEEHTSELQSQMRTSYAVF